MNRKSDSEYFVERLNAELEAAAQAKSDAARAAHQALADYYASRLNGGDAEEAFEP